MKKSLVMIYVAFVGFACLITLIGQQSSNEAELQPIRPEGIISYQD